MAQAAIQSAWKVIPGLQSRDIAATCKFYTEELHFELGGMHTEGDGGIPTFLSVAVGKRSVVNLYHRMWEEDKGEAFHPSWVMIAMGTEQLDEYYNQLLSAGRVEVSDKIADRSWGYRQFSIKDGDGNTLTFFRFLEGGNPGTDDDE